MLAYVFWHRPGEGADAPAYEARLTGFHAALAEHPPGRCQNTYASTPRP